VVDLTDQSVQSVDRPPIPLREVWVGLKACLVHLERRKILSLLGLEIGWLVCWVGWLFGWFIDCRVGWIIGWLLLWWMDWLVGWLVVCLVSGWFCWRVGHWVHWLVGRWVCWLFGGLVHGSFDRLMGL